MIFWEKQKVLTTLYERVTKPVCEKYGLTQIEYDVVMFLHNNPQYKTASDIVKMRKLTKSHVSVAVGLLEEKGYVLKRYAEGNRKSAILVITEAAESLVVEGEKAQRVFGQMLLDGFDEKEKVACLKMFVRLCENANKFLTNKQIW